MDLKLGQTLGSYKITERLVAGGMAKVYRALQVSTGREVAIKVVPITTTDEQTLARFEREMNLLSSLQHPHILGLIDAGREGTWRYLVMPLVRCGDLEDLIAREDGPLPLPLVRRIALQLCEALEYSHSQGVVHRDIKPANVLRDERDNCLLTDFGIALPQGAERLTQAGHAVGTLEYLAPEQGLGESDARSDLYALGVILFQLITGKLPFKASSTSEWLRAHSDAPIPSPRSLNPAVPPALDAVVVKALAKKPEDRFQNAAEFAAALRLALPESEYISGDKDANISDSTANVAVTSPNEASQNNTQQQKRTFSAALKIPVAIAALLLLSLAGWWLRTRPAATQATSEASTPAPTQAKPAAAVLPSATDVNVATAAASAPPIAESKIYDDFKDSRFENRFDPARWKQTRADARIKDEQHDGSLHIRSQESDQGIYAEFVATQLTRISAHLRLDAPVRASGASIGITMSRLDHPGEWVSCYLYATRNATTAIPSCTNQRRQEFRTGTYSPLGTWHEVVLKIDADNHRVLFEEDQKTIGELLYPGVANAPATWYVMLSGWSADGNPVEGDVGTVVIERNP